MKVKECPIHGLIHVSCDSEFFRFHGYCFVHLR